METKKVRVNVMGNLTVRISHSMEVELEVPIDMEDDDIEQEAKAQLEADYYANIQPVLQQLEPVVGEWDVEDHNEEAHIEEIDE